MNGPTTLQFDEQVEIVQAGRAGEISISIPTSRKAVVINPLKDTGDDPRNMVIITKNHSFNLNYKIVKSDHHQFLKVKEGAIDSSFKIKLETRDFRVLEGDKSYMVINQNPKKALEINHQSITSKAYFSKGLPLFQGSQIIVK